MPKYPAVLLVTLLCCCFTRITLALEVDKTLTVPLRFHIVSNLGMNKDGLAMESWINETEIRNIVLPAVNAIWQQANIQFVVESIAVNPALDPPDKQTLIRYVVNAERDSDGESDPERIRKLEQLIDWGAHADAAINVYLVPYLGEASQGNAKRSIKRVFVAQWSDKSSKGKWAPARFALTEARPFREGSLSRTLAHELGHIFGLKHPDRKTQTIFDRLMGGKRAGYDLTQEEIAVSRQRALALAK